MLDDAGGRRSANGGRAQFARRAGAGGSAAAPGLHHLERRDDGARHGAGRGGRNQEFALAAADGAAAADAPLALASVGTDGIDGPTDAAGAIVDSTTMARAAAAGLAPERSSRHDNDAYTFFDALGDLIRTGPTGTNVGDLQVLLLSSRNIHTMLSRDQVLAHDARAGAPSRRHRASCCRFSKSAATSAPRSSATSRSLVASGDLDPDPRPSLRPARKDGSVCRPPADASGGLRVRRARASARSAAATSTFPARISTRRCTATASSSASSASRKADAPKGASSGSSSAPTRGSSAATIATKTAWATSCRSIGACSWTSSFRPGRKVARRQAKW